MVILARKYFASVKPLHKFLLALASGALLSLGWPAIGNLNILLFVALVPLLWASENHDSDRDGRFFWYANTTFLVFNIWCTWWVWFASPFGAVAAILLNALFSTWVFQLVRFTAKKLSPKHGFLAFIVFWIAWEFTHHDWDLSWPWLTLGNGLANVPEWVQWYEYTGAFGGSFWILVANLFAFWALRAFMAEGAKSPRLKRNMVSWVLWVAVPIAWSYSVYNSTEDSGEPVEVVVVQPNVDPYNEKFSGKSGAEQISEQLALAQQKVSDRTTYVVGPETAIPGNLDERAPERSKEYRLLRDFVADNPQVTYIIGASSYKVFLPEEELTSTARSARDGEYFYDFYNTAIQLDTSSNLPIYHKSKLVPGVEILPFMRVLKPVSKYMESVFDLGGTSGGLGTQSERTVFFNRDSIGVAPVVCYESIYGDFTGEYVRNGAELIFIITNDGWWRDTPGYKQHAHYGRLRAVEHRRSIARSANTGISCFINQRGDILQPTNWWVPDVITGDVYRNDETTYYTRNGDVIARTSLLLAGLLLLYAISRHIKTRRG